MASNREQLERGVVAIRSMDHEDLMHLALSMFDYIHSCDDFSGFSDSIVSNLSDGESCPESKFISEVYNFKDKP